MSTSQMNNLDSQQAADGWDELTVVGQKLSDLGTAKADRYVTFFSHGGDIVVKLTCNQGVSPSSFLCNIGTTYTNGAITDIEYVSGSGTLYAVRAKG